MKLLTRVLPICAVVMLGHFSCVSARGTDEPQAVGPESHEQAVAAIERLSQAEKIEGSYFDMAVAASRIVQPVLDERDLRRQIEEMAEAASVAWEAQQTPKGKVEALNRVIFDTYGFATPRGRAPIISGEGIFETYALPGVMKGKRGHCEGLGTIYLLVAEQAGLPVVIVHLPVHTLCRVDIGDSPFYVETTESGALRSATYVHRMNGAKPAAVQSGVYLSPSTKKQFLSAHVNVLAYGLIQQKDGPMPLDMSQMVRLADVIERLDPKRPESLETAALIHFKAGDVERAHTIINRTVELAETYGAPDFIMRHYRKMQRRYRDAVGHVESVP